MKPNIIYVADYNQKYVLSLLENLIENSNAFFLYYSYEREVKVTSTNGKIIFWKDYKNAFELVDIIKPEKVIFINLETLNQMALNCVCRFKKIPTIYHDHGFRDFYIDIETSNKYYPEPISDKILRICNNLSYQKIKGVLKNRLFYDKSIKEFKLKKEIKQADFLQKFKKNRLQNGINEALKNSPNNLVCPSILISFSLNNLKYYEYLFKDSDMESHIVGYPEFDDLAQVLSKKSKKKTEQIILIDQPYEVDQLYGWNNENKSAFVTQLKEQIEKQGFKLKVKSHPRGETFWNQFNGYFEVLNNESFREEITNTSIILGYDSTLLLIFAVNSDIDLLIIDENPDKTKTWDYLIKKGLAGRYTGDIKKDIIIKENNEIDSFVNQYLYKLDGKAKERIHNIVFNKE